MIACQKANCKNDFQIEFLYKVYDAAEILSWRNSKSYVVEIEIWWERKDLWHTVNNSRETAMSKVHMQHVIPVVYKALPFLFSINKAFWKACLVHWFCYTTTWWNILTYKMILCHVCVSLLCLQCKAAGYIGHIQQCQAASLDIILSMALLLPLRSLNILPFFISPSLCIKWQDSKPLWICVFVCVCVKNCWGGGEEPSECKEVLWIA